ncbi:MAG: FtsX-like permease family protein, partial [Cyclobacteriaceae bacterium]
GSRAQYKYYLRYEDETLADRLVEKYDKRMRLDDIRTTTVEERKERLRRNFDQLTGFLNLVAFIALLLGCIGVASTVHVYVRSKIPNVAVLRCLGAKGSDAFFIYLIQIGTMGLIGSILGAILGSILQYAIPGIFQGMLTVEVSTGISTLAILQGILTGFVISLLFALLPLLAIRNISPLVTLRAAYEPAPAGRDWLRWVVGLAVILFVLIFAYVQTGEWTEAGLFTLFICFAYLVLLGAGKLLMWAVRRFLPSSWPYVYRQGVANLYRPNNQTIVLLIAIGLGTGMLASMVFVQHMLLDELRFAGGADKANLILYDIQQGQRDQVAETLDSAGLPLLSEVPVVTTRIAGINGRTRQDLLSDTTDEYNDRSLSWEYRITFREELNSSEQVVEGTWEGRVDTPGDSVYISLDSEFAERLGVGLNDKITWNIQGLPVETYVGSLRQIDWNEVDANFMVLFPSGVLEKAPHFSLMFTHVPADSVAADIQQLVVSKFSNVTVINLGRVFDQIGKIVDKMAFVIRFMALFSILTGLVVLISSVLISRFQRIRESVLLRTLGASRKQIWLIQLFEYLFLGSLAVFTGILLATLASGLLAYFVFKITFTLPWLSLLVIFVAITGLAIFIGLFNSREVVSRPPLAVLRKEI